MFPCCMFRIIPCGVFHYHQGIKVSSSRYKHRVASFASLEGVREWGAEKIELYGSSKSVGDDVNLSKLYLISFMTKRLF